MVVKKVTIAGFTKKSLGIIALLLYGYVLPAQEFWMRPNVFNQRPGDVAKINFNVGTDFIGDNWNLRMERVKNASLYLEEKPVDLKWQLKEGTADHLSFVSRQPGTYVIVIETNNAFVELPADKFNAYLKENALDKPYAERENSKALNKPGKEAYTRNAKLIFQVGDKITDAYKINAGMPLEIIPQSNPVAFKVGDRVYFKLLFNNKPLFGARVFVWNSKDKRTYNQPVYSQEDGTIEVRIFNDGDWMLSAVWMESVKTDKADWQSYWGSLVFHVNP